MNDNHKEIIVKLTIDLTGMLEKICTVQRWEYASLLSEDDGSEEYSEADKIIHKNITTLEKAEMNIQHTIDLLKNISN